ncbi:threonylcarbamoyl-AMP synthase [Candidatus Peregrinibacteria bacterium]|nr:threonylcarbamoyl-AMP synthase [Candidatus Peregrinibacteria bacterium]
MEKVLLADENSVRKAVMTLDEGGIVMHPTETCYGLAADIFNKEALSKLYYVKDMKADKPLSILVDSPEMALEYGTFSKKALALAKKYWPGALSIVVPRTESLPKWFNPGNNFVSMRVSGLEFCREMVKHFGGPITTTSANKAGEPEMYQPETMAGIDLIVDGGLLAVNKPSTIVMVDGDKLEVLRQGEVVVAMG